METVQTLLNQSGGEILTTLIWDVECLSPPAPGFGVSDEGLLFPSCYIGEQVLSVGD